MVDISFNEPDPRPIETMLHALRKADWRVAAHNDYRLGGNWYTFWLFTHPSGLYVKGEGETDEDALVVVCEEANRVFAQSP